MSVNSDSRGAFDRPSQRHVTRRFQLRRQNPGPSPDTSKHALSEGGGDLCCPRGALLRVGQR
eukprot:3981345-Alexandrium_andersonii.AAC.1